VEIGKENFIPDLALQGIICSLEEITNKLHKTTTSTTVVFLNHENSANPPANGETPTPQNHNTPNNINNNLVKQYYPSIDNPPQNNVVKPDELLLRPVEISHEVNEIIEKIFKVEGNFVKQGYIAQMMSLLLRKATVLLKYVEAMPVNMDTAEIQQEQRNKDEAMENEPPNLLEMREDLQMSRETKKRIRNDLGLREDSCFNLLLGIAEKLKPGIYYTVVGNQAWIEEKLIELFERF